MKIAVIGGLGTIGQMICPALEKNHDVHIIDVHLAEGNVTKADAIQYEELLHAIPKHTDIIINLISIPTTDDLINLEDFDGVMNAFFKTTYVVYKVAAAKHVKKVIYASSNHAADFYEQNGVSKLGREIEVTDYPYSKGVYGVLKLASENIGHAFHKQYNMQVINLRIGTVRLNEKVEIMKDVERFQKTWLSEADTIQLFEAAVDSNVAFGTYFAVSDNENKPWSIGNTVSELGFEPQHNAQQILKEIGYLK